MINEFKDEYEFLSNFYPCILKDSCNNIFPTAEHYFQAMKTKNPIEYKQIQEASTPGQAKRLGRKCSLRADWEQIKDYVMEDIIRQKFSDPKLRQRLLSTGNEILVEGTTWNDRYWGIDLYTGIGQNKLGKILMKIREEIQNG